MGALFERATDNVAGYRDVDPRRVAEAVGKVRLVDVREPDELRGELGHIDGVEGVPLGVVERAATTWNPDQEIVLVCRSGGRSPRWASAT